jgi:hypothetical protein
MKSPTIALLGALTLASPISAESRFYVPLINAVGPTEPVPGSTVENPQTVQRRWVGNIAAFNGSAATGTVTPIAVYGSFQLKPNLTPYVLPAGTGASVFRIPWAAFTSASSPGPLGFVEIVASDGVAVTAAIERAQLHCGCLATGQVDTCAMVSQGRSSMPVFDAPFPAGKTVVCGDISLGAPTQKCGYPEVQQYPRRVNVTLFNASDSRATFVVTAVPLTASAEHLYETTVSVAPWDVIQLNRLPIPVVSNNTTINGYDVSVWIRIVGTQPYLAYASSVFEDGVSGSMPFEVFPPRLVPAP